MTNGGLGGTGVFSPASAMLESRRGVPRKQNWQK